MFFLANGIGKRSSLTITLTTVVNKACGYLVILRPDYACNVLFRGLVIKNMRNDCEIIF